jgi:PEP-CTERM putative exosortase interaction domain
MKSVIASLVAVAGLSVAAVAEVNTRVDLLVSTDGVNFSDSVNLLADSGLQTVEVLVRLSYIGSHQTVAGFASAVFQPTVSNWGATDVLLPFANGGAGSNTSNPVGTVADAPGQYGRISPFARTGLSSSNALFGHVHTNGAGGAPAGSWLRIAQRQITSWIGGTGNTSGGSGVPVAQLASVGRVPADPPFAEGLVVNVFRFGLQIDTSTGERTLLVDAPLDGFGNRSSITGEREIYWWSVEGYNGVSGDVRGTPEVVTGAINVVIPAPASLALLGLGGLCVARRRR